MSKRSLFWSTASGKLGDIVLRTVRGEAIASKYQPKVLNPRSYSQMIVRAQFATAVKFFRHARDNFFKFAFEDKKRNESDYNAFMRYNARRGCIITKYLSDRYSYPAWGNRWLLANGSLPSLDYGWMNTAKAYINVEGVSSTDKDTIGDFSKKMIDLYGLQNGDYITFVFVVTQYGPGAGPTIDETIQPKWYVSQIELDETSAKTFEDYGLIATWEEEDGYISFEKPNEMGDNVAAGFAAIASRVMKDKTLVSSSELIGNDIYNTIVSNYNQDATIQLNLKSWGATEDAILKGSIANKINNKTFRINEDGLIDKIPDLTGNVNNKTETSSGAEDDTGTASTGKKSTKSNK